MMSADSMTIAALSPIEPFRRALSVMLNFGQDLLGRVQGARKLGSFDHLPKRWRHPKRAEPRLTRTMDWIFALARTLAGDRLYLRAPRNPPSATPRKPAKPRANPIRSAQLTEEERAEQRAVARLRYIRMIFATQPTSRIAKRLARRLGAKEDTDWWPEELLTISETPAAWAARAYRAAPQQPPPQHPEPPPPDPPAETNLAAVPFHRRE